MDALDLADLCLSALTDELCLSAFADELCLSAVADELCLSAVASSSLTSRSAFRQACTTFLWADTSSDVFCTRVVEAGVSSHVCRSSTIGAVGEATCEYV